MPSPWLVLTRVGVLLAVAISFLAVRRFGNQRWAAALRARFLMGVPWGTVVTVWLVLFVYLFVQGGLWNWFQPVALPFRAWSYRYPLGMVLAPFSHVSPSHLFGNLVGMLALAPLAEYAWDHYPTERGSATFSSLRTNPFARALAVPAAAVLAGLFTSFFALGPIIGFSGVVFAFAGFALVRYPLSTVVAFSASEAIGLVYNAVRNPVVEASAEPSFGTPWWADIAIQAHAIGLLLGVLVGIAVFRRRAGRPSAGRLWLGTLVFAVGQSLWAVYWFRGNDTFVLFRALGAVLVFSLALLVAASVAASGRFPSKRALIGGVERRGAAAVVILLALAALSAPAIPVNLMAFDTSEAALAAGTGPDDALSVRDYSVTYAENVTNQLVSVFNISVLGETTAVEASGVIVESERRHIWTAAISADRLAFTGRETVRLGGLGWAATVAANRNGWRVVGGERVYNVYLDGPSDGRQLTYLSEPATAALTIRGKNISIAPQRDGFAIVVSRHNDTLGRAPLPDNGTVRAANLTFSRDGKRLFVSVGETRVRVAKQEDYQ
jgi:membrane associated rhomboid family serine protease